MVDVLFNNDDITVLGSPPNIDLLVDIGPKGDRGSQIYVSLGNPNSVSPVENPLLNDLCINVSPGVNYGYLYQYVSQPGGNTWAEILKISPTLYNEIRAVQFTNGVGEIVIPVANITSLTSLTAENFAVRYSIANDNPIASSMSIFPLYVESGINKLKIQIKALESSMGGWYDLDGESTVHLLISIQNAVV